MTTDDVKQVADRLLEQHLRHEMAHFDGDALVHELEQDVDALFRVADSIRLADVIDPATVNGLIRREVVERDIPPIIPEMAAEFTNHLVSRGFHQQATPSDIISRDRIEGFVDELLVLREQRRHLIDRVLEQPIYRDLIASLMYEGLVRYVYEENLLSRRVPGVTSALRMSSRVLNKAMSGLDEVWEKSIKSYIGRNLDRLIRQSAEFLSENLTDDELRMSMMDAWDSFSGKSLSQLQQGLGEVEWSEFVVMGYDFWLSFRRSEYFRQCYETVVEQLFEQYGNYRVSDLLEEFAIDRDTVMTEIRAVVPQAMDALRASGLVESLLRRRLERFYTSEAALEVLAGGGNSST